MKSRGVVGKRIVAIEQRVYGLGDGRGKSNLVTAIVLEDGTRLEPYTIETASDYGHEFHVVRPGYVSTRTLERESMDARTDGVR